MNESLFYTRCLIHCGSLWEEAATHPFVLGLAAGKLTPEQIQCYLIQDGIYLVGYVEVCRKLAARSVIDTDRKLFEESARLSEEGELEMQHVLAQALGFPALKGEAMPATTAYSMHEIRCAENKSRLVALAGAVPCNVLYAEVGKRLENDTQVGRLDHPYRMWIDLYADKSVQDFASRWQEVLNRWGSEASDYEQEQALDAFAISMRHELNFWEQAFVNEDTGKFN